MTRIKAIILSDSIRCGKTTTLRQWAIDNPIVYGVLSPDIGDKRVFQDIETKEIIPMESDDGDLTVGKYRFKSISFKIIEQRILNALADYNEGYVVLDEVGPLEIRKNLGFHELILKIQNQKFESNGPTLILVVRDFCLEEFTEKYHFKDAVVLSLTEFKHNFILDNNLNIN